MLRRFSEIRFRRRDAWILVLCSIPVSGLLGAATIFAPSIVSNGPETPADLPSLALILLLGALFGVPFGLCAAGGAWLGFALARVIRIDLVWILVLAVGLGAGAATLTFGLIAIAATAPQSTPWQTVYANAWPALLLMSSVPAMIGSSFVVVFRTRRPAVSSLLQSRWRNVPTEARAESPS
jgi:ABC-type polysaccharide/polyol phosphate export permease